MRLSGLIGRPGLGRPTRHDMVAFVNARPVDSRALNGALIESYRESLPPGRYPVAFVFLQVDPAQVDVNVHPAKREVRFRSEALVRGFIIRSILSRHREWQQASSGAAPEVLPPVSLGAPGALPYPFHGWSGEPAQVADAGMPPPAPKPAEPAAAGADREGVAGWHYLSNALGSYALFETPQGLILLDRRAAHERVWYERLKAQFAKGGVPVQRLLLPISIELNPLASAMLIDHLGFIRDNGLEISEFGRNFFRVEALPAWMEPGDAEPFILDLVGALREGRMPGSDLERARDEWARLAAAKAVRLPPATGAAEARGLLRELFATSTPVSSPSGRPTYVELNHGELARRFQK